MEAVVLAAPNARMILERRRKAIRDAAIHTAQAAQRDF
jgi:hypothetical protein